MKLIGKKQRNGKPIAIFDTEGATIVEIADALAAQGFSIDRLVVTYEAGGEKKKKEVPTSKLAAVQAKYGFDRWAFSASTGAAVLQGQVDNGRGQAVITQSKNGAIKAFSQIPAQEIEVEEDDIFAMTEPEAPVEAHRMADRQRARDEVENQVAQAMYGSDAASPAQTELTSAQKAEKRSAARAIDAQKTNIVKASKHTGLLIIAIIEILFVAPILFGVFAAADVLRGRRLVETSPEQAQRRFRDAKTLVIGGAIFAVAIVAIGVYFIPKFF